jgi:hypothetical protein
VRLPAPPGVCDNAMAFAEAAASWRVTTATFDTSRPYDNVSVAVTTEERWLA